MAIGLVELALGIIALVGFYLLLEKYLRSIILKSNKQESSVNNILFYSDFVAKKPNSILSFRLYTMGAKLVTSADCHLNNMGYFSDFDYFYEKPVNEFRIVILGGEQTASSVVSNSWPDFLQKILNDRNCFSKAIKVINLAWPDAGPEHYLQTWETEGIKFNADLVIVNIVETDYYRYLTGTKIAYKGHCLTELKQKKIIYDFYNGKPIYMAGYSIGETEETATLANSKLIAARPFGFFAPFEYINNTKLIAQLQQRIAKDFTLGGLPTFGMLTGKFIKSLLSINFYRKNRGNLGSFIRDALPQYVGMMSRNFESLDSPKDLEVYGDRIFNELFNRIPNILFTHSFNSLELINKKEFNYSNSVMKNNPKIQLIDMREKLPNIDLKEAIKEWYLVPHMNEKWSTRGHRMYANLIADLLIQHPLCTNLLKHKEKSFA